jgi:hypothetical protein
METASTLLARCQILERKWMHTLAIRETTKPSSMTLTQERLQMSGRPLVLVFAKIVCRRRRKKKKERLS